MVPANTTFTLDVKGTAGQWLPRTVAELRASVIDSLTPFMHVYDVSVTRDSFLSDPENLFYWAWPYVAVVTVQTRVGYADVDDVASIVAHAFYSGGGRVPTVTVRGTGPQQNPDDVRGPGLFGSLTTVAVLGIVLIAVWAVAPYVRAMRG